MSVSVCRVVTVAITQEETIKEGGGGGADRDGSIETGVMGVCEGSVCASVQNMGKKGGVWWGYDSQAELDYL